jgi:hypothetical protein
VTVSGDVARGWRRLSRARAAGYCVFSSVAFSVTSLPALSVMVRCQLLKPGDSTEIVWSPGDNFNVEGVSPRNLPSTLTSAPSGVDFTDTVAAESVFALAVARAADAEDAVARVIGAGGANLAGSSFMSPFMKAVISVPLGIVMSLPCMNRTGARQEKTR